MSGSMAQAFAHNFLGHSPRWYKASILAFLILNPLLLWTAGPVVAGWLLVAEFIFCLAMALKCYPLMPGGLLMITAVTVKASRNAERKAERKQNSNASTALERTPSNNRENRNSSRSFMK